MVTEALEVTGRCSTIQKTKTSRCGKRNGMFYDEKIFY